MKIERLSSHHDRGEFDCGVEELNTYLQRYAGQHDRKGMGRTYVAVEEAGSRVLGYYTISSSAVAFDTVPENVRNQVYNVPIINLSAVAFDTVPENVPRHPIPVALIGRLAVDKSARGRGVGETLLIDAIGSARRIAEIVGVYAHVASRRKN